MLEQLEVRRLLAIATETVTVNSATLATDRSGTYFSGATTGIPGTTPPPSWQQADRAAQILHVPAFDTQGGTRVLVKTELVYRADAVTQFTDSLGPVSPFFKPDWSIENTSASGTGTLTALSPNTQTTEPTGRIMLANAALGLNTSLTSVLPTAGSGNVELFLSPNPRTIDAGTTLVLSANDVSVGMPQSQMVTNKADLGIFSSTRRLRVDRLGGVELQPQRRHLPEQRRRAGRAARHRQRRLQLCDPRSPHHHHPE